MNVYISSGNQETAKKYDNHIIMYPLMVCGDFLEEDLITAKNLKQQKFKKLIASDMLIVAPDHTNNKEMLAEIFVAQEFGLKIIHEESGDKFEYTYSLKSKLTISDG